MSWKDNLQNASYAGVVFEVESATDSVEHAISEHAYPFLNGTDAEDLGLRARKFSVKIVIWGDDYELKLSQLIQALDTDVPSELIHPVYGSVVDVLVASYTVSHSADSVDYCTIDVDFIQSVTVTEFFKLELPGQKIDSAIQLQEITQNSAIEVFNDVVNAIKNNMKIADEYKKEALKYISSIRSYTHQASLITDVIKYPAAFCAELASAARGIIDLRSFSNLSFKSDWESIAEDMNNIILFDKRKASTNNSGGTAASKSGNSNANSIADNSVQNQFSTTANVIATTEKSKIFCEILKEELKEPTLNPEQIETIANDVRSQFNECIDDVQNTYDDVAAHGIVNAIKTAAHAVTVAAKKVVEAKPPLITRTVESPSNLHLLAFLWYGDYKRAQELVRLNPQIRNPNKINVGEAVYGYAK